MLSRHVKANQSQLYYTLPTKQVTLSAYKGIITLTSVPGPLACGPIEN